MLAVLLLSAVSAYGQGKSKIKVQVKEFGTRFNATFVCVVNPVYEPEFNALSQSQSLQYMEMVPQAAVLVSFFKGDHGTCYHATNSQVFTVPVPNAKHSVVLGMALRMDSDNLPKDIRWGIWGIDATQLDVLHLPEGK
jgi:hypothetical protein